MLSSTDELGTGSTHDFHGNSEDSKLDKIQTPKRRIAGYKKSQSGSPASPMTDLDDDVQEEIDELLENVAQIANNFTVINKIGSGTFSSVYVAKLKNLPDVKQMFALKYLIPTSHPSRIESELKCLQQIGGCDNVMGVKACLRERDHVVIVMPYFPHERFQDYVACLTVKEVRDYIEALLVALQRVHSVDIIHRDVKPSNFLYNRNIKQYALVDFGLAQKAPSIQLGHKSQSKKSSSDKVQNKIRNEKEMDQQRKRSQQGDGDQKHTSQKRKLSDNSSMENTPRKKRPHNDTLDYRENSKKLAEIDMNIQHASKISESQSSNEASLAKQDLVKSLGTKDKSLQKALLRKRALECITMDGQQGKKDIAPPGVGLQKPACTVIVDKSGKQMYKSITSSTCDCYGKPQICSICTARSNQHAPRAGTPGFRAPEVLLKYPEQSTAVDIWSAGVIYLSLLSGRYPFFKAPDDVTALAQIISLFGTKKVQETCKLLGKSIITNPVMPGIDLKLVCQKLHGNNIATTTKDTRNRSFTDKSSSAQTNDRGWDSVPDSAYDLLEKLLDLNPHTRLTAKDALKHPFFKETL